ncbi:hypothetical protein D7V92_02425 [Parabacteroides sp. CH2-D42-20]|uniref:hypothetical protein n=1 Tax=Parabacteroides sp. CH2-D42-20 TaxID=2320086 RepID=UPI000EF64567|nr:hypothetical protein [Parabacteroides sp. CH2-D42-20]RLT71174.1 hypothetical protein D7V92_02425 [Parabacteroides sp. CH2-D42-20]
MKQIYLCLLWLGGVLMLLLPINIFAQTSIEIDDGRNSYSSSYPMDWSFATHRSQSYYAADLLNLPKGSKITSISYMYETDIKDLGTGGDLKISLGELPAMPSKSEFSEKITLVYQGKHNLETAVDGYRVEKKVTYTFQTPYTYQGGCLVVDVSNQDSPRSLTGNIYFKSISTAEPACLCLREERYAFYASMPSIAFTVEPPSSDPILYVRYNQRTYNYGYIAGSASYDLPITNLGKNDLHITKSESSIFTVDAVTVKAGEKKLVPIKVKPKPETSFLEKLTIQSDGGSAVLSLSGTTWKVTPSSAQVELSESKRLSSYGLDFSIQELSILGEMQRDDWRYLYDNFNNLRHLDLSSASYWTDNFPSYSFSQKMASANTLEYLSLPQNIKFIYSDGVSSLQLSKLKHLVLPVSLESFSESLSNYLYLSSVVFLSPKAPSMNAVSDQTLKVYVPKDAIDIYKNQSAFRKISISPITQAVMDGAKEVIETGSGVLKIEDDNESSTSFLIDYRESKTHTQLFYPKEILALSAGTKIKSISFFGRVNNNEGKPENGTMRIACKEYNGEKPTSGFVDMGTGTVYYEGSDNLDFTNTDGEQMITYVFNTPYEYKGGCLVLDLLSTTQNVTSESVYVYFKYNQIEDIYQLVSENEGSPHIEEWAKPNVQFEYTNNTAPLISISGDSHKAVLGCTPVGSVAPIKYVKVRNQGASDLTISKLSGVTAFSLMKSVTIPAGSLDIIGLRYEPNERGSHSEKGLLESNGGNVRLLLQGTTYRQAPYWTQLEVTQEYPLERLLSDLGAKRDTITALSISGNLTSNDWSTLRNERYSLPSLRCLDLSTATVPDDYFSSNYSFFQRLEQFALPSNIQSVNNFSNHTSLTKLILPVGIEDVYNVRFPEQLTNLIIFAPTPPSVNSNDLQYIQKVYVPENRVDAYNNSWEWRNKEILPITDEILGGAWTPGRRTVTIRQDVVYDANNYPKDSLNIKISPDPNKGYPTVSLESDVPLLIDTLILRNELGYRNAYSEDGLYDESESYYSSFINHSVDAKLNVAGYEMQLYPWRWNYLSFPFDVPLADLKIEPVSEYDTNPSFIIRYYDGNVRATNGIGDSWKDVVSGDVLKAGKGYIVQTDHRAICSIMSDTKQALHSFMGEQSIKVSLDTYASNRIEDQSWNLVGNPFPSFFNIHYIEYNAPIVVWNGDGYIALSVKDDDYALRPLEAFFTQKPDEKSDLLFQPAGRQINSYIADQGNLRSSSFSSRRIINLVLKGDTYTDKSRVVINPEARIEYELTCDAVKWMSPKAEIPQLYSLDGSDRRYAINERPEGSGRIALGVYIGKVGTYELALPEGINGQSIILKDKYLNKEVDLSLKNYSFQAEEGTFNDRFELLLSSGVVTGTEAPEDQQGMAYAQDGNLVVEALAGTSVTVYSYTGVPLINHTMNQSRWITSLSTGFYLVRIGDHTYKVIMH